jgi:tetrahydromethanopterin S-methyltransferase subunit G
MEQCTRHVEVVEQLDELEERVRYLEIRDTATSERLDNLIAKVEKLVTTIEQFMGNTRKLLVGIAGTSIMVLVGFFFWYIEKL